MDKHTLSQLAAPSPNTKTGLAFSNNSFEARPTSSVTFLFDALRVLRPAIYARVSSEEQIDNFSIDAQLRACRNYAADNGYHVVGEYVDEGRSARTDNIAKRPQFRQMLEDASLGLFDVLLVHKLDRFSRNRRITDDCLYRLYKSKVGFVSLNENLDYSTPAVR